MAAKTNIQWTNATWNPITGCSVISPGCKNCYAMRLAGTRMKHHPSRVGLTKIVNCKPVWTGEVRFNDQWLDQPLHWKKPRRIFVCAHSDLFHENVPDEWIDKVFAVMALCPQHVFQVLTKRSQRMRAYLRDYGCARIWMTRTKFAGPQINDPGMSWPLPNVHLGVSVEDQENADLRIPGLLAMPAAVRWVSYEPALGLVDFEEWIHKFYPSEGPDSGGNEYPLDEKRHIDWIVVGGESGPDARPFDIAWARSIIAQCEAAGVACFVKQLGTRPYEILNGALFQIGLRDSHGADMAEWPADLRVRQYPETTS